MAKTEAEKAKDAEAAAAAAGAEEDASESARVSETAGTGTVSVPGVGLVETSASDPSGIARGGQFGDVRAGAKALGVEYGNPYDPTEPPWPVRRNPTEEAEAQRLAEMEAAAQLAAEAGGDEYRYDGHKAEGNQNAGIVTEYGTVYLGGTITLPDDKVQALRDAGHKLTKVTK